MANPFISICVPTFNGEKYLAECLDSCINQTFKDYEIVVCDDCSGDRSISIIEAYATKNKQIRVFRNEKNVGLVLNCNKCIELAKGEWIKFMFQDDFMNSNCLEKFVEQIDDSVNLIVCKRNFMIDKIASKDHIDYYNKRVRTLENTKFYDSNDFDKKKISLIYVQNISMNFIAEPPLSFFRKEIVTTLGMFDNELKQICDLEFLLRIASNYGLRYIPEKLCSFRIHESSTTEKNQSSNNYYLKYLEGLHYTLKVLSKKEFGNLRKEIGFKGNMLLKLHAKYHSYRASRAIKTDQDKREFKILFDQYKNYMFRFFEVPFLWLLGVLR